MRSKTAETEVGVALHLWGWRHEISLVRDVCFLLD